MPYLIIYYFTENSKGEAYNKVLKSMKVLRCLRALRPLRVIGRSESLRLGVTSLFEALPAIFNGLIVASLVLFVYSIVGTSYFKGSFFYC